MAFCPECRKEMEMAEPACPHCGYDFPASPQRSGLVYSGLADFAILVVGGVVALGAVVTFLLAVLYLLSCHIVPALLAGTGSLVCFAVFVVFVRISDMNGNRTTG